MNAKHLEVGKVYKYVAGDESVKVMYTGVENERYGFRAYNEESGGYDGYFNTLNVLSVMQLVSKN